VKKLLLLSILSFFTTKAVCSEKLISSTPDRDQSEEEEFFTKLANPTHTHFKAIKALCKEKPDFVKKARDASGNGPLQALFFGARCQHEIYDVAPSSVDWHFSLPTLYELLQCGLNPAESSAWDNLTTLQTELMPSFLELLNEHKDEPGDLFITEKTKEFSILIAQEKEEGEKYAAMVRYWTNNWGNKKRFRSSRK
jgi:hypothetical protein